MSSPQPPDDPFRTPPQTPAFGSAPPPQGGDAPPPGGDGAPPPGGGAPPAGGGSNRKVAGIIAALAVVVGGVFVGTQVLGGDDEGDCASGSPAVHGLATAQEEDGDEDQSQDQDQETDDTTSDDEETSDGADSSNCIDDTDEKDVDDDEQGGGDTDGAVETVRSAFEAAADGDCDAAAEYAAESYREGLVSLCESAPEGMDVGEAEVTSDDPVVVKIAADVAGSSVDFEFQMTEEDGEWLIAGLPGTVDDPTDDPTEPTDDPTESTEDPEDDPESGGADDLEAAADVAERAFEAIADGDCTEAREYTADSFADQLEESLCESAPESLEILGAEVAEEDPVIVLVSFEAGDESDEIPIEMQFTDGEWLMMDLAFGNGVDEPGSSQPTDRTTPSAPEGPGGEEGDPEDAVAVAEDAVQLAIDGDCGGVAALATESFQETYGDSVCDSAPSDMEITGAAVADTDPVVVEVTADIEDEHITITLDMAYENGTWLVDDVTIPG